MLRKKPVRTYIEQAFYFSLSLMPPIPTEKISLTPPKQTRSRRTLERIVSASLAILDEQGPAALTVQAVVARAGSSVGSFYARFKGKSDLLDYLGARVWQEALERWSEALASRDWSALELSELAVGSVGLLYDAQRSRSSYLRALDRAVSGSDDAYTAFRRQLLDGISGLLLARREEIDHLNPDLAVRLGLLAVLGVIDTEELAVGEPLPRSVLVKEATDLLLGYLVTAGPPASTENVDFFDIWG
jgi:AcrR family transcriptional regulator